LSPALRIGARALTALLLTIAAWRSINYISGLEPGNDSSIFMSVAMHTSAGRVLYKEIWENKPPVIFVLDAIAMKTGDHKVNSVRTMERVFAIIGVAAAIAAIWLAFGRFWIAAIAALLLLFNLYMPSVFEQGNVTEEYGTILMLAGMAATVASLRFDARRRLIFSALAGLAFSLAALCKEPFVLIVLPWFVGAVWPRSGDWKSGIRAGIAFIGAALIPVLIFFAYLIAHGAFSDWLDMMSFQVAYSKYAAPPPPPENFLMFLYHVTITRLFRFSTLCWIAALAGIASLASRSFVRAAYGAPIIIVASAAISLLATSLGGRYYGHYFLEFVPSFALLSATGIAFAAFLIANPRMRIAGVVAATVFLIALAKDTSSIKDFAGRLAVPSTRWNGLTISESVRINTQPTDFIWAPWKPLIYTESGRLSPTRWHFGLDYTFLDTRSTTREQKFAIVRSDLSRHPPRIILVNRFSTADVYKLLDDMGLSPWIAQNYQTVMGSRSDVYEVLAYRGPAAPR
jgi:hypothetical protein